MFKVYPWENMLAHDAQAKHLCGQACLQKLLDRWLNAEMTDEIRHVKRHTA
jgi:glutathionylspermidine synthase